MRFSAIHKAASYLMVTAAFAALALSRELPFAVVLFTIVGGGLSALFEPSRHGFLRARLWSTVWNVATLAAFGWTVVDTLRGEPLSAGVRFLCFLLVNKLWNRRASRDYLQAYVVSFLMLVAGAALSSDLSYAGCFLAYVVFATWTLTLFHLRREMEENYLLKHSDGAQSERVEVERILASRRIVGGSFLAATSVVSVGIFVCATLVFFLIPRFGFGFFVAHGRRGATVVGFSEHVDLGEYGLVKDNPQVVMRVELPLGPPPQPLHLRGVSFDRYHNGHWSRTDKVATSPIRRWQGGYWLIGVDNKRKLTPGQVRQIVAPTLVQHVYLDPLDTPVLFGTSHPVAFELKPTVAPAPIELEARGPGEVYAVERHVDPQGRVYGVERKTGLRYTVYSDLRQPPDAELAKIEDGPHRTELHPYLALPNDLPSRVAELARRVTAGAEGPFNKARAVERYLQKSYKYTLDLKRDERYEPLEDFLFVQRAGHCAYFASAMAVMLRVVGVPTRSVNGFLAGEWNGYGKYLAVRQGDAHSWVEVWLEGAGWVTFDPTPSSPAQAASGGLWTLMRQMVDTAELAWFKYVIEYDLGKQVDMVQNVSDFSTSALSRLRAGSLSRRTKMIFGGLLFAVVAAVSLRRARRGGNLRGRPEQVVASHAFARALRALEKRGYPRGIAETGRELAVRVEKGGDPAARSFAELVELYYVVRFGSASVDGDELERLAGQVVSPNVDPSTAQR